MSFFNSKYPLNSPLAFLSLTFFLNCIGGFFITNSAQAFTLDFSNPAVIEADGTRTINTGVSLDPNVLDGAGQNIDLGDGNGLTTFSTTSGAGGSSNVADLFSPIGIDITFTEADGVGLFNSLCDSPGQVACETGANNNGDPDLATGPAFGTTPQGNLIINEENAGDSAPDDFASGGDLILTFDQGGLLNNVLLESITFVDDVEAEITVNFTDSTSQVIEIDFTTNTNPVIGGTLLNPTEFEAGNNALGIVGGFTQSNVADIEIDFAASGGIGEFTFAEFTGTDVVVPFEFSPGLGLLLSGVGFLGLKFAKRKKLAPKLEQ